MPSRKPHTPKQAPPAKKARTAKKAPPAKKARAANKSVPTPAIPEAPEKELTFESIEEMRAYIAREADSDKTYRMVGRPEAEEEEPEPEEPEEVTPNVVDGEWGSKPSINRQLEVQPSSVREKAAVTVQFVMSDAKQVEAWNRLQARMHPPQAPQVRLVSYRDEFCPTSGTYVLLVSYSEIEYQQLV